MKRDIQDIKHLRIVNSHRHTNQEFNLYFMNQQHSQQSAHQHGPPTETYTETHSPANRQNINYNQVSNQKKPYGPHNHHQLNLTT